jgi:hypothetical protein
MKAISALPLEGEEARVIVTDEENGLAAITRPDVQAVIYIPPKPAWLAEIADTVEAGRFRIHRVILPDATDGEIAEWLERNLPAGIVVGGARTGLQEDILALVGRLAALTGAGHFMLRIFTETPSTECGFHVDSVPPAAPAFGLLRVYNGAGTDYVDPANVTSMADFYRYLSRRERLARNRAAARKDGDGAALARLEREIAEYDEARPFLRCSNEIRVAPAGSIVAFKHIDIRHHWSDHPKALAWIHSSPVGGAPRLVVNVTAPRPRPRILRRATNEHAD